MVREPGYIAVLATKKGRNIKRLLLIKEKQVSQVKKFSTFLWICRSLGSLKSFFWHVPQLSGASILCYLSLSFLRVHCWMMFAVSNALMMDFVFPSCVPLGLTIGVAIMGWLSLQHPMFTDVASNIFHSQGASQTLMCIQTTPRFLLKCKTCFI